MNQKQNNLKETQLGEKFQHVLGRCQLAISKCGRSIEEPKKNAASDHSRTRTRDRRVASPTHRSRQGNASPSPHFKRGVNP